MITNIMIGLGLTVAYNILTLPDDRPLPPPLEATWWGPGKNGSIKSEVRPFKINVSDSALADLKYRLDNHRPFTPPLEGIQQQYGMNTVLLKEVVDYWRTKYDWRSREKILNELPQFMANIQGLDIHFIHVKPNVSANIKVLPLLLSHGWPGSVREFYKFIPILTTPQEGKNFVFEVIAPSIPGFGFSKGAVRPGMGPDKIALVYKNLMNLLGFQKFYLQGGDFGHIILNNLAVLYPDSVLGFHSNWCYVATTLSFVKTLLASIYPGYPSWYVRPEGYSRVFPVIERLVGKIRNNGYLHEQATKPDTVGVGVNDSPVGLAAYILEKITQGTNYTWVNRADAGLQVYYTYDELIDNLMYYWIPSAATTAFRLYSETFNVAYMNKAIASYPITVPTACLRLENDFYTPDGMLKDIYVNLKQLNDKFGGHYIAWQFPDLLAKDVFSAVELFEQTPKQ